MLEFFRRSIAQRGVQPLPIVILLDELSEVRPQVFQVILLVGVDFFPLQRLDEAFAASVVVRVRLPAYAML